MEENIPRWLLESIANDLIFEEVEEKLFNIPKEIRGKEPHPSFDKFHKQFYNSLTAEEKNLLDLKQKNRGSWENFRLDRIDEILKKQKKTDKLLYELDNVNFSVAKMQFYEEKYKIKLLNYIRN